MIYQLIFYCLLEDSNGLLKKRIQIYIVKKLKSMLTFYYFYTGGSPLMYSPAPRGDCENCCQIREPKDIKFLLYTK